MRLPLNEQTISACREDAKTIAKDMKAMIDTYTTVSVERTIARFLGIDGVNDFDIPYANILVDHIAKECSLDKGVAHYMSYAIHDHEQSPQAIAEAINLGTIDLSIYQDKTDSPYMDLLTPYIEKTLTQIDKQTKTRNQFLTTYPRQNQPEKYVIVATGNIHEDIKQAVSAAKKGADVIAVIRTTGQSLLDYVPYGATTEGFGGTYATQENFRLMREALDAVSKDEKRYIKLVNYASGLCMPEIAALGAMERLDMMLNDSLYGIIFRDINMKRTMIDQYFSRVISAYADITINTGEDNYLTTADAFHHAHNVLASQFINEQFAKTAYMKESLMGLGHAYEIDPTIENSFLYEMASAQLSRDIFKNAPLKYMPPTKHMTGDIFKGTTLNTLFNIATVTTNQNIHLLGMITEAIHTPFMSDRALALDNASLIYKAFKDFGQEITYKDDGIIATRAITVLNDAKALLDTIKKDGLFTSLENGVFADVKRSPTKGKGLDGVVKKHDHYHNPVMAMMINRLKEANHA